MTRQTTMLLFGSILFFGCSDKESDSASTDTEDTTEPAEPAQPEDTQDSGNTEPTYTVTGEVTLADGAAANGTTIQVCASSCRRETVDENGKWEMSGLKEEKYIVLGFSMQDDSLATTATHMDLTGDRDLTTMVLHPYATSEAWASSSKTYDLDGGLSVTFNGADLSRGDFAVKELANISSVKVPLSDIPMDAPVAADKVAGIWMLGTFAFESSSGIEWSIRDTLGLEDGTDVEIFFLAPASHTWESLGTTTVAQAVDGTGMSLPALSTLLIATQ